LRIFQRRQLEKMLKKEKAIDSKKKKKKAGSQDKQ
jgi:hypothetical protein